MRIRDTLGGALVAKLFQFHAVERSNRAVRPLSKDTDPSVECPSPRLRLRAHSDVFAFQESTTISGGQI